MEGAEAAEGAVWYGGGRLPGRSTKEKGREKEEVDEDGEERRNSGKIVQEVVAGIKEKVSVLMRLKK